MSVYVHCKTHRKRSGIEMNETLNLHRQRTKWTADIELDKKTSLILLLLMRSQFVANLYFGLEVLREKNGGKRS